MIIPFLFFLLCAVVGCGIFYCVFDFLPQFLRDNDLYTPSELFASEERDIVYSREDAVTALDMKAVVRCNSERSVSHRGFTYDDVHDCRLFKNLYEADSLCRWGCIGFGSCITYCPQDAIEIINNTAHINGKCTGCGVCLESCPNHLLMLIPKNAVNYVACAAHGGTRMNNICTKACTGCEKCTEDENVTITDNLAKISYTNIAAGGKAFYSCPSNTIVKYEKKTGKGFKFWQLCYNMINANSKKDQ